MDMNHNNGDQECKQKQKRNDPPLRKRERAANKNISLGRTIISKPQKIPSQNYTGHADRTKYNRMLIFWPYLVCHLSLLKEPRLAVLAGLGCKMEDRILPHDLDAEAGVLNAAFYPGGMSKVFTIVTADDFYSETARLIFSKLTEYHESGRGFTLFSIDQDFQEHPQYIDIRRALDGVRAFTDTAGSYHAGIVKERADRRREIRAHSEVIENLFDTSKSIDQVKGLLRVEISGIDKGVVV